MAQITFHVIDENHQTIPLAGCLLSAQSVFGPWQGLTDAAGNFTANLAPGHYDITFTKVGFRTRILPADLGGPGLITVGLVAGVDPVGLPVVMRDGLRLMANGQTWMRRGSTELPLLRIFDHGGDVSRVFQDRKAVGVNHLTVLSMWSQGGNWIAPTSTIRSFTDLAASYGLYVETVCLADCQVLMTDVIAQQNRWAEVSGCLLGASNAHLRLGNEFNKNGFDPNNFARPNGLLAANASTTENYNGWAVVLPFWDYASYSAKRDGMGTSPFVKAYDAAEVSYEFTQGPCLCGEGRKPGTSDASTDDYARAGRASRVVCGGNFHTSAGTSDNCRLFTDDEIQKAHAFFGAA